MQAELSNCVRKAGSVRPDLINAHFRASLNTIPSTDASAAIRRFERKHLCKSSTPQVRIRTF